MLHEKLNSLLPIRGLWEAMRIGVLHKITAMHCDEAICCYWDHILQTFLRIVGGQEQLLPFIDGVTVQLLDSRVPQVSARDRRFLQKKMDDGKLFPNVEDRVREEIWRNLIEVAHPIPTLRTFFKDRVYLEVAQSLYSLWDTAVPMPMAMREECLKPDLLEFWRFCFQYGFEMTDHRRLKTYHLHDGEQPPLNGGEAVIPSESELWAHFYALMRARGFRPQDGSTIANPTVPLPVLLPCEYPSDPAEEIEPAKRCGKPYSASAAADRFALTAAMVQQQSVPGRVTAGFLRRTVFDAFFGYLKSPGNRQDQSTFEPQPGPTEAEVEGQADASSEAILPNEGNSASHESTNNVSHAGGVLPGTDLLSESAGLSTVSNDSPSHPVVVNFKFLGLPEDQEQRTMEFNPQWIGELGNSLDEYSLRLVDPLTERSVPPGRMYDFWQSSPGSELDARPSNGNDVALHTDNARKRGYRECFPDGDPYDDPHAKARRFILGHPGLQSAQRSKRPYPRRTNHNPGRVVNRFDGDLSVPAFTLDPVQSMSNSGVYGP
ncbi:hypothetical protein N7468_009901 [Penicillium chermesinum]|uniref:Uncharacterized protein n=1 Tax=Penicillium chermesinum TaxID=63820 RepID=A0A9W9NDJ5_9EURO|nr:uncharacterized protein N7468_009901 [Penicillium chermesinum]KAJ5216893.1 hypothetical protein N7468_009901 [Penicillium chermesinum]